MAMPSARCMEPSKWLTAPGSLSPHIQNKRAELQLWGPLGCNISWNWEISCLSELDIVHGYSFSFSLAMSRDSWEVGRGPAFWPHWVRTVCVCAQSCLTLCNSMDCSLPGSSVHGILQARIWSGCHALLQGIVPTQGGNPCLLCLLHWQADSLPTVPSGNHHS